MKLKTKIIFVVSLLSQSTLSWAACTDSSYGYIVSMNSNNNYEEMIGVRVSDDINGTINLRTFTFPHDARGASIKLSLLQNAMVMGYNIGYTCLNNELIYVTVRKKIVK